MSVGASGVMTAIAAEVNSRRAAGQARIVPCVFFMKRFGAQGVNREASKKAFTSSAKVM